MVNADCPVMGEICAAGTCAACTTDSQCDPGEICASGLCGPVQVCDAGAPVCDPVCAEFGEQCTDLAVNQPCGCEVLPGDWGAGVFWFDTFSLTVVTHGFGVEPDQGSGVGGMGPNPYLTLGITFAVTGGSDIPPGGASIITPMYNALAQTPPGDDGTVAFSFDMRGEPDAGTAVGEAIGDVGVTIQQNTFTYLPMTDTAQTVIATTAGQWDPLAYTAGLEATDFCLVAQGRFILCDNNPDFSATAAPIKCGFFLRNTFLPADQQELETTGISVTLGIDNFSCTFTPASP